MARRRNRNARSRDSKRGLAPGTPVYTGTATDVPVHVNVIDFDATHLVEREQAAFADVAPFRDTATVTWLDFHGLHDTEGLQTVCEHFGVHPLAIEDLVSVEGRPKADDYGEILFVTAKMADIATDADGLTLEHISFVLGPKWLLSFQERPGDVFGYVRKRIRTGAGRVRHMQADYLMFALLDALVDGYFAALAHLEERLDALEDRALEGTDEGLPRTVHVLRGELQLLRRAVGPLRLAVGDLQRTEATCISDPVRPYMRDLADHLDQVGDGIESARERLVSVLELHLATNSQRMNDVMKGLTVVATVFIPLTFVAGIYGMNFDWMPELHWWAGYPVALGVMAVIAGIMVAWMRRQGWM